MARAIFSPNELQRYFDVERSRLGDVEFIDSPRHKPLQDVWIAAQFGAAYAQHIGFCDIQIDVEGDQDDNDFELIVGKRSFPVQSTEVQEPDRRRGQEYRAVEAGVAPRTALSDWEPGTCSGPQWIASGIQRKVDKTYARANQLILLVYANFFAYQLQRDAIDDAVRAVSQPFRSVWIITGDSFAAIKPDPELGGVAGWKHYSSAR